MNAFGSQLFPFQDHFAFVATDFCSLPAFPCGCVAFTMAGDASVPFSFAEAWEEESSQDQGRLRSRSREFQTYNSGGVARDVVEDDDEGFLAAQRQSFEEALCARRLEEREEQIPPESSHAEANDAVMVSLFKYPFEDPFWKGYATVCTAGTKTLRIPCGTLVWAGYRNHMHWLVAGKVNFKKWSSFVDEDPRGPSAARCSCCHRPAAASEGAEGPEVEEISYPFEDAEWRGYACVCTAGYTKTVRIPLGCLVWRGCSLTSQMQWMVTGMVSMNEWTTLTDDGPLPPEVETCAWCKRSGWVKPVSQP